VQFCTVLTAFAESDFRSDAVQRETIGVFQQNPKWWPTATQGTAAQCMAFLADFARNARHHNGDPVHDVWITQRWLVPNDHWPDPGVGWRESPESQNYVRRLPLIDRIITERRLP
jgi:hypothetical protein